MNIELVFANSENRAGGWKLDPGFLNEIQTEIVELFPDDLEELPSLEQIEMVLLAFSTKNI